MTDINQHTTLEHQGNFISGTERDASSDEAFIDVHPSTNTKICSVGQSGIDDVNAAVAAARAAQPDWAATPAVERSRILMRAVTLLREANDELAYLETLDTGKPLSETLVTDVVTGADVLEFYASIIQGEHGSHHILSRTEAATVSHVPLGVCVGIGAWNYPIQIALWKSAPALATGNAFVFKPSEKTPLTALRLAELFTKAGVPDGVFNVIQGDGRVGAELVAHPHVDKVSLTGEATTGQRILSAAAPTMKHVTLELGGKSPIIVRADADLELAAQIAVDANFYSTGQVCSNGTRVFVDKLCYDEFASLVVTKTEELIVGNPFDRDTTIGPLIDPSQHKRVMGFMEHAMASSATHLIGGNEPTDARLTAGNYVMPAVFGDCTDHMDHVQQEVFGPLMSILAFSSDDEAVQRANNTRFGLGAGVVTNDFAAAHNIANKLDAGFVWINTFNVTPPQVPFGGSKDSGIGRENGLDSLRYFTQPKTIYSFLG